MFYIFDDVYMKSEGWEEIFTLFEINSMLAEVLEAAQIERDNERVETLLRLLPVKSPESFYSFEGKPSCRIFHGTSVRVLSIISRRMLLVFP
jgi:hypothetical protein